MAAFPDDTVVDGEVVAVDPRTGSLARLVLAVVSLGDYALKLLLTDRRQVFAKIRSLAPAKTPFVNLPDERPSRWGEGLTAEKMKECVWLRPEAVAQIEFLEWSDADRLRHSKFVRLRTDKDPRSVVKENAGKS